MRLPPDGLAPTSVPSLYGCNMAVREDMFLEHSFCEELPLYGWAWSIPTLLLSLAVVAVHESRAWRRVTRYRNQHRRRTIIVTDSRGVIGRA